MRRTRPSVAIRFALAAAMGLGAAAAVAVAASMRNAGDAPTPEAALDAFHAAASRADGEAYFDLLAEDAIFLGTDPGERWTREAFRGYAEPHFRQGRGWTYVPRDRHVHVSADGTLAWFDEALDNASYGVCRGTGVLRRDDGRWRIVQYSLSIPIPNDLAREVVDRIRGAGGDGGGDSDGDG